MKLLYLVWFTAFVLLEFPQHNSPEAAVALQRSSDFTLTFDRIRQVDEGVFAFESGTSKVFFQTDSKDLAHKLWEQEGERLELHFHWVYDAKK